MGNVKGHNTFIITVEIEVDGDPVQMRSVLANFDSVMRAQRKVPESWIIVKQAIKTKGGKSNGK